MATRFATVGIIADGPSRIADRYAEALCTRHVLDVRSITSWQQLSTWARNTTSHDKYIEVAILLTDMANEFLGYIRGRYGTIVIAVPFRQWSLHFDYDHVLQPWEVGWGVSKDDYSRVAGSRMIKRVPAFHMLSECDEIERELLGLGYKVFKGRHYHMADVAIEPSRVLVPDNMYAAAASGMPVISVRANQGWTKVLGVYEGLFLDDVDIGYIVSEVRDSDFLYAGMIARDMVPDWRDFRIHIRALLQGIGNRLGVDSRMN